MKTVLAVDDSRAVRRMNGLELLQQLGVAPRFSRVPVVDRVKEAGARGWISKPFQPEALLAAPASLVEA